MKYPRLAEIQTVSDTIDAFYGYNHQLRISDGEFYAMENMSSSQYPVLAPRGKRGTYKKSISPTGMIAKDSLCYVDGAYFCMNQYRINMGLSSAKKQLVSMGAYVIILPDKKYINTADVTDYGDIEASVTTTGTVTFALSKEDGSAINVTYRQASQPTSPNNLDMWIDTSAVPHTLKQYSAQSDTWALYPTTYIKISATGIGAGFDQYDGVEISGLTNNADTQIAAIDGSFVVWSAGDDYIVVTGILDMTKDITDAVTVKRRMPAMDFVIESGNRLWGCRYGLSNDNKVVNEIYASKLGDFRNWSCYMGISTDSYTASCGTDGMWTGAITHMGYPCFFKENRLHKVYGNQPSNFQIQDTECRGVQRGSSGSLAIVNETLYYKSRNGICAYDGSLPSEISTVFGEEQYNDAVGGAHGSKYYVSMTDSAGSQHLFVYDAGRGMWHREDGLKVSAFCSCRNELYLMTQNAILTEFGSGTEDTARVKWTAETGIMGTERRSSRSTSYLPGKKYISQLQVRMSMDIGSTVKFYIEYDSTGSWEHVTSMQGTHLRSFCVPIRPKRCDHFRLRIVGEGGARIYCITRILEKGSDL